MGHVICQITGNIFNLEWRPKTWESNMAKKEEPRKTDFRNGFPFRDLRDGAMVSGQVDGEEVMVTRRADEFFAVRVLCTHYGRPVAEAVVVGDTVRGLRHHACFRLRTGEALR